MERIKFECIGLAFQKKAPNGMLMTGIIVDDPAQFKLYKLLELDVFDNSPLVEKIADVTEVIPVEMVIETSLEKITKKKGSKSVVKDATS